jgi:tetratricopeptide (TPR) repeat protein
VLRRDTNAALVQEETIDDVGADLLKKGRPQEAVAVLTLNAGTYPGSATARCSLADAYRRSGQTSRAIEECREALAIDPSFMRAKERLRQLGSPQE